MINCILNTSSIINKKVEIINYNKLKLFNKYYKISHCHLIYLTLGIQEYFINYY